MTISAPVAERAALLVAGRSEQHDLESLLRGMGYLPVSLDSADLVPSAQESVALCVIDLRQNGEALRTARAVRAQHPQAVIIGVADPERPTASADAIRAGVFDVLPRPATARDLEALIANAREQAILASMPQRERGSDTASYGIAGTSSAMRLVMDLVQRAAAGRCGILICGERGTGREMIARAIHSHDPNPDAPFVKVDCSGPTPEEIELQLFGVLNKRGSAVPPERRSLERIGEHSRLRDSDGGLAPGRHGRNDDRPQVLIEFVRRDDEAGTSLLDLAPQGRVESDQVDITACECCSRYRHCQSFSSKCVRVDASRS